MQQIDSCLCSKKNTRAFKMFYAFNIKIKLQYYELQA